MLPLKAYYNLQARERLVTVFGTIKKRLVRLFYKEKQALLLLL
jgi:hypothetical protein